MKKLIYLLSVTLLFSCAKEDQKDYLQFSKNSLDYQITPTKKFDKSGLMFSDQGAWFAYSFPDSIATITGFSGPFLMTQQNGIWSSSSLTNLIIENHSWASHKISSYNSHLEQTYLSEQLELNQELVFSSGHTAIIKSTIKNRSNATVTLTYFFKNEQLLADGLKLSSTNNQLTINSNRTDAVGHIIFPKEIVLISNDSSYVSKKLTLQLKPNQTKEITISQTFIFSEYSWSKEQDTIKNSTFETFLETRKKEKNLQNILKGISIVFKSNTNSHQDVYINNYCVTEEIRSQKISSIVSKISSIKEVRKFLVEEQRKIGESGGLVAEGRDIGTTVFPHAELKIFLTASIDERAKRRKSDKNSKDSQEIDLHTLKELIKKRDFEDSNREISPLIKANDAIEIITDGYSINEVVDKIIDLYNDKIPKETEIK